MQNLYTLAVGNKSQFNWFVQNFLNPSVSEAIEIVQAPTFPTGGIANTGELASGLSLAQAQVRYTQGALSFKQVAVTPGEGAYLPNGQIGDVEISFPSTEGQNDSGEDILIFWAIDLFTGNTYTQDTGLMRGGVSPTNFTVAANPVTAESSNFRVMGFSFYREDNNGVKWSQISYPAMTLNGSTIEVLPLVIEGAYNVAANRPTPPTTWGLN
jgi:hypothetical protein